MHILGKSFRVISKLPAFVNKNYPARPKGVRCLSQVAPVKLKFDVFTPPTLDPNLPPIIIMHGLFGSRHNWRSVSKSLSQETNRKIYAVDARNHGDSPHTDEHGSLELATDVAGLMKDENVEKACVIGHSMGGRAMMVFALNFPQLVEKAVIVDVSPIAMPGNSDQMMLILSAMESAHASKDLSLSQGRKVVKEHLMSEAGVDEGTVNFILLSFVKTPSGEFEWKVNVPTLHKTFPKFRKEQYIQWPPFTGPVLFACGEQSPYMNMDDWPKVKTIFPNAEIKWFDAGHLVHLEQPAQLIQELRVFLQN